MTLIHSTRPSVTLRTAQHVLWHFGDTNYGIQPGEFTARLMLLASTADAENLEKLRTGWPELIHAWECVARKPWGLEWLRSIVKSELDGVEAGLDWTAFDEVDR